MPKIKVRTKDQKVYDKLVEAFEKTVIVQKQKQLTYGRWDFVVFGQTDKNETVLREGYAEQASIKRVLFIASLRNRVSPMLMAYPSKSLSKKMFQSSIRAWKSFMSIRFVLLL